MFSFEKVQVPASSIFVFSILSACILSLTPVSTTISRMKRKKTMSPNPPIGSGDKSVNKAHF